MFGYTHCDPHVVTAKLGPVFVRSKCNPDIEALRYRYRRQVRYKHWHLLERSLVGEDHVELTIVTPVKDERHVLSEANLHFVQSHASPLLVSGRHCLEAQGEQAHASGLDMASETLRGKGELYQSASYTQLLHASHAHVDRLHSDPCSSLLLTLPCGPFVFFLPLELLLKLGQGFESNIVCLDLDFDSTQIVVNLLSKPVEKLLDVCQSSFLCLAKALFPAGVNRMWDVIRFDCVLASPLCD